MPANSIILQNKSPGMRELGGNSLPLDLKKCSCASIVKLPEGNQSVDDSVSSDGAEKHITIQNF